MGSEMEQAKLIKEQQRFDNERGHVFVVRGVCTRLACDAFLNYGGRRPVEKMTYGAYERWRGNKITSRRTMWEGIPNDLYENLLKKSKIKKSTTLPNLSKNDDYGVVLNTPREINWPKEEADHFTLTTKVQTVAGLSLMVREGLKIAHQYRTERCTEPMFGVSKFTYGITNIGADTKTYQNQMGELFDIFLTTLQECAHDLNIDVVVSCWDKVNFNMMQSLRVKRGLKTFFPYLHEDPNFRKQKEEAERLVDIAAVGKLVVFAGAGISIGSGLPSWGQLLNQLGQTLKPPIDISDEEWIKMDMLSKAEIISRRLAGTNKALADHIIELFQTFTKPSVTHYLLASLPCTEYVTTNYDELLEIALKSSDAAPDALSILPHNPDFAAPIWVLKMHGSVTDRDSIVLTREDYIRYEERASALGGIIQAKMMTSHMLFVGFSLSDDNFFRIADTVKKSLPENSVFGTSLQLPHTPMQSEIWKNQLDFVNFSETKNPYIPYSARRMYIWLDYLCAITSSENTPIMDPRFKSVCSPGQNELREKIETFMASLSVNATETIEFQKLKDVIESFRPPVNSHRRSTA